MLYATFALMDGAGNPATGGILPAVFSSLATWMTDVAQWPTLQAMGWKGMCALWYAGMGAANYTAGYFPPSYPGLGGTAVDYITPSTEAQHVATAGSGYLNQWEPFLTPYAATMYRPKMYSGPPPIDSGITTPELRAHSTILRSVGGIPQWDSAAVLNATTPNLPAWLAREDLRSLGFNTEVESWDANYIAELDPWYGPGFAGASAIADNSVVGTQRAETALPANSGFHNPTSIRALGGRPGVFIFDTANPAFPAASATPAQCIARMSWWMSLGVDVHMGTANFSDRDKAEAATTADAWTRRWNRWLIEARHARTFMRR